MAREQSRSNLSLLSALKMEAAELLWTLPKSRLLRTSLGDLAQQFLTDGCCVLEGFMDPATVDLLVAEAERIYSTQSRYVSRESNGSDDRIYGVDRISPPFALKERMKIIDEIGGTCHRPFPIVWFQLLGKIRYTPDNAGSGSGWHRDSPFSHQFKALLYLTDVAEDNGPFEYIKGSHSKRALKEVARFLGMPAARFRFSVEQVEQLERAGILPPRTTITGRKGTLLLADTRGLHRGRPLQSGERLAVTRYYFPRKVPAHFTDQYALTAL